MKHHDIVIVGGGPAGLAAAVAARKAGISDILILERDNVLGGILNQCIHNGFGLHTFKEELTGPEYAARYIAQVEEEKIPYRLNTIVVDITRNREVTYINREEGMVTIRAGAVILAMGCRERPRGALNTPGYRPAGIYSAGTAQRLMNIEGYLVGKETVILGSGDIGLIMARRMTLEGAKVKVVAEIMPYSGGLKRNIVQCLDDYGIPLKLSHTVVDIHGKERLTGVTIAEVDENKNPIPGTEEYYSCDTLLLSVGLIPENELSKGAGISLNRVTSGPNVNDRLETEAEGIYACGNVLHVHDLVDFVSQEAALAGENAAEFVKRKAALDGETGPEENGMQKNAASAREGAAEDGRLKKAVTAAEAEEGAQPDHANVIPLIAADGVRYTVPQFLETDGMRDSVTVRFRVADVYKDRYISVYYDDQLISRKKKKVLAPGEMEQVVLSKKSLAEYPRTERITIRTEVE